MPPSDADTRGLFARLAEPFPAAEIEFKPAVVKANRCMALAYLTARAVEDRLDDVLGPHNWRDAYDVLADGNVRCRLELRVNGEWVGKEDTGSPSEQPDGGDRTKAAFSDALKRAAVKWGIGRYLYFLDNSWCDYDPVKKQITQEPRLPAWALPGGTGRPFKADHGPGANGTAAPQQPAKPTPPKEKPLTLDDLRARWQGSKPATGTQVVECVRWLDGKLIAATGAKGYLAGDLEQGLWKAMGWGEEFDPAQMSAEQVHAAKAFVAEYLAKCEPKAKG
jgi:hypothetical protein